MGGEIYSWLWYRGLEAAVGGAGRKVLQVGEAGR